MRISSSCYFSLFNFFKFFLPDLQPLTPCIMSPSKESSLFVLVEPHDAASKAVFEYPENVKYRRYGRARADLAVGHHDQDGLNLSAQVANPGTFTKAHFRLSLSLGPKDLSKGFVFGSDPRTCDILLAKDKISGISGNHFSINVDWRSGNPLITCLTPDDGTGMHIFIPSENLVRYVFFSRFSFSDLTLCPETCLGSFCSSDVSRSSLIVPQKSNADSDIMQWKLYLRDASREIEPNASITVRVSRRLKLLIHSPSSDRNDFAYNKNLQDYLKRCQNAIPDMSLMKLYEPEQTPLMISRTRGLTGREYVTTTSSVGDEMVLCEARGHQKWARESKIFVVKRFRSTRESWKKHAKTKLSRLRALQQVSNLERMQMLTFITDIV